MPILQAIDVVTTHLVTRVLVPKFARRMTTHLRRVDDAYSDVWVSYCFFHFRSLTKADLLAPAYLAPSVFESPLTCPRRQLTMGELIAARRVDPDAADRTDLFTSLVQATDDEKDDSERLEDHELFGEPIIVVALSMVD